MKSHKKLLTAQQTTQKIRRIAFEIYERNLEEPEIILAGITGGGYQLGQHLQTHLREIAKGIEIKLFKIDLNKENPHNQSVSFDMDKEMLAGKVIIVVDDVLNTGRTLAYSLSPFLSVRVKRVQVAVMVNRAHHSFPIFADYVGYALSTTLNEHITVQLADETMGVFIN